LGGGREVPRGCVGEGKGRTHSEKGKVERLGTVFRAEKKKKNLRILKGEQKRTRGTEKK